jgi:hypothetical protein
MKDLLRVTRLKAVILITGCLLLSGGRVRADESVWQDHFEVSGWVEAHQSVRAEAPHDSLTSRAWLRLELAAEFDELYGFVSIDGEKNREIDSETGVDLHEAWLEKTGSGWDLRVGRQTIIWGKADGVQITDIISPPDYTEAVTRDLEEIRQPVDGVKFRLLGTHIDTELIWLPVFKAAVQPTGDNPWTVPYNLPAGLQITRADPIEPETSLENSEIALKVSTFLSGLDAAASVFYTWDDFPAQHRNLTQSGGTTILRFYPQHHRLTVFGLEFSRPWSDFVFRGEAAYYKGRYYEKTDITDNPVQKDAIKWLVGVDWSPGNDWSLIAQLTGTTILDYQPDLADSRHSPMATLNVSKKLMRQTLTLSNMVYYRIEDNDFFNRVKAKYEIMDNVNLQAGIDIFYGPDNGSFGCYQDNTQVWMKLRYSF